MHSERPAQRHDQRCIHPPTPSPSPTDANPSRPVKRALRALQSPAYQKASSKNPSLPPVTSETTASEVFKLLPLSLLALRVTKIDPHEGHGHAPAGKPQKRVKGLWTVRIEQQQDIKPELHYVWLYEGSQLKQKLYAGGALTVIMAVVMFPLWPIKLRIGVWYLSMGMLGLIGLFFAMAIFRLILFCVTVFAVPPGLWLYPNLFEDVGFFDSFKPVWGWQEVVPLFHFPYFSHHGEFANSVCRNVQEKKKKSKSKKVAADAKPHTADGSTPSAPLSVTKTTNGTNGSAAKRRDLAPRIEDVVED